MLINKRIAITTSLLGGATLLLLFGMALPIALSVRTLTGQIVGAKERIETRYTQRLRLREALDKINEARPKLLAIQRLAVRENEELEFIHALEQAAGGLQQEIALVTANQKDLSAWERAIPFRLIVSGDFRKVVEYLDAIERLPYSVLVEGVDVGKPRQISEETPSGAIEAVITGTIYWQKTERPAALREK